MSKNIEGVRGMNDALPVVTKGAPIASPAWLYLENVAREWLNAYGYKQIRTPIVESTDLFVRGVGEHTDIVEKEMYSFEDKLNGERLTLRPEGTAGTVRACIEHGLLYNQTQRLWYIGQMYRHERPQKGRYRQFHQIGAEAFGFEGPDVDAEQIVMLADFFRRLGLTRLTLELNTLGEASERAAHRAELIKYLEGFKEQLDEDGQRRLYTNPLRVLDTKNPALQEMANNAPRLLDFLGEKSRAHFEGLKALLDAAGVAYVINPRLVRGLDYYNLTVFEWTTTELGTQATVGGGGRYDGLVEQLGGKPCPGVGFGLGIERMLLLLEAQNIVAPAAVPDVYLVHSGETTSTAAFTLAHALRQQGLAVVLNCGGGSFKSQFKKADASGARFAVVLGDEEVANGTANLKTLTGADAGAQVTLPSADLLGRIRA